MSKFFSNGTGGRAWEVMWCQRCEHDHSMHDPETAEGGCVHLLNALVGRDEELDGVWFDETEQYGFTFPPAVRCAEFAGCVECGHGEVVLDGRGFVSEARQQEYLMLPDGPRLLTDRVLTAPRPLYQGGETRDKNPDHME